MNNFAGLSVDDAKKKLEHYCAYQERCYKEVIQKLHTLGMQEDAQNFIIDHLVQHKFLDESRFAVAFARGKHIHKYWGNIRIKNELNFREISAYNIQLALKEIENTYQSQFEYIATKKWQEIKETNIQKKKAKWVSFLTRKGFEYALISNFLEDILQNE